GGADCAVRSFPTRRSADLLVADIEPAEKGLLAVDHHDLAMVAEVDLEARPPMAVGPEVVVGDTSGPELLEVGLRQLVRADLVVRSEEHASELQSRENLVCR